MKVILFTKEEIEELKEKTLEGTYLNKKYITLFYSSYNTNYSRDTDILCCRLLSRASELYRKQTGVSVHFDGYVQSPISFKSVGFDKNSTVINKGDYLFYYFGVSDISFGRNLFDFN